MFTVFLLVCYACLADFCTILCMKQAFPSWFCKNRKYILIAYWSLHLVLFLLFLISLPSVSPKPLRAFTFMFFLTIYACKSFLVLAQGIVLLSKFLRKASSKETKIDLARPEAQSGSITRSQFISRTGIAVASLPFIALNAGMISGVYDYRVRKVNLVLPNLPKAFDGLRIAQISDIHSGSFYNKKAVSRGIDLLQSLKADVIFFTGDLVNDIASEMKDYQDIFSRVKAPMGVFSILGNHDYGDYAWWPDAKSKQANLDAIKKIHGLMGYQLLCNEHRMLKIGSDEIAILGVENWGSFSRFPKYGRVDLAIKGAEEAPVKLLLSHDPTHWKAKVIPNFKSVDVMFSGHTHGMQMGIRTKEFQWSPVQYFYKEWAGLYTEGHQRLYVNVGYGFLGYPGRIGMNPEITHFTLSRS